MPSQPAGEVPPASDWTDAIYLSTDAVYSETGWIEWTPGYTHAGTYRIPVMLTAAYDVQGRTSAVGAGDGMDVGGRAAQGAVAGSAGAVTSAELGVAGGMGRFEAGCVAVELCDRL